MEEEFCDLDYIFTKSSLARRTQLLLCKETPLMRELVKSRGAIFGEIVLKQMSPVGQELIVFRQGQRTGITPHPCSIKPWTDRIKKVVWEDILTAGLLLEKELDIIFNRNLELALHKTSEIERRKHDKRLKKNIIFLENWYAERLLLLAQKFERKLKRDRKKMEMFYQIQLNKKLEAIITACEEKIEAVKKLAVESIEEVSEGGTGDVKSLMGSLGSKTSKKVCPSIIVKSSSDKHTQCDFPEKKDLELPEIQLKFTNAKNLCDLVHFMCVKKSENHKIISEMKEIYLLYLNKLLDYLKDLTVDIKACFCECALHDQILNVINFGNHKIKQLIDETKKSTYNFMNVASIVVAENEAEKVLCQCDPTSEEGDEESLDVKCVCINYEPPPKPGKIQRTIPRQQWIEIREDKKKKDEEEEKGNEEEEDSSDTKEFKKFVDSETSPSTSFDSVMCQEAAVSSTSESVCDNTNVDHLLSNVRKQIYKEVNVCDITDKVLKKHFALPTQCLNSVANDLLIFFRNKVKDSFVELKQEFQDREDSCRTERKSLIIDSVEKLIKIPLPHEPPKEIPCKSPCRKNKPCTVPGESPSSSEISLGSEEWPVEPCPDE